MTDYIRRVRRRVKPAEGVRVNPNNSLVRDLVGLWSYNGAIVDATQNSVPGYFDATNPPEWVTSNEGKVLAFLDGADGALIPLSSSQKVSLPYALAIRFRTTYTTNSIFCEINGNSGLSAQIGILASANKFQLTSGGTDVSQKLVSASDINDGSWHTVVVSVVGVGLSTVWLDGVDDTSATNNGGAPLYGSATTIDIGARPGAGFGNVGVQSWFALWDRGLSNTEVKEVTDNPYQLWAPIRRFTPVGTVLAPPTVQQMIL